MFRDLWKCMPYFKYSQFRDVKSEQSLIAFSLPYLKMRSATCKLEHEIPIIAANTSTQNETFKSCLWEFANAGRISPLNHTKLFFVGPNIRLVQKSVAHNVGLAYPSKINDRTFRRIMDVKTNPWLLSP